MKTKSLNAQEISQRVIVFLNREQVDFLDKVGKDTLFSGKKKLSRTKIIASLVNLIMKLDINGKNLDSTKAIVDEIKLKIKNSYG